MTYTSQSPLVQDLVMLHSCLSAFIWGGEAMNDGKSLNNDDEKVRALCAFIANELLSAERTAISALVQGLRSLISSALERKLANPIPTPTPTQSQSASSDRETSSAGDDQKQATEGTLMPRKPILVKRLSFAGTTANGSSVRLLRSLPSFSGVSERQTTPRATGQPPTPQPPNRTPQPKRTSSSSFIFSNEGSFHNTVNSAALDDRRRSSGASSVINTSVLLNNDSIIWSGLRTEGQAPTDALNETHNHSNELERQSVNRIVEVVDGRVEAEIHGIVVTQPTALQEAPRQSSPCFDDMPPSQQRRSQSALGPTVISQSTSPYSPSKRRGSFGGSHSIQPLAESNPSPRPMLTDAFQISQPAKALPARTPLLQPACPYTLSRKASTLTLGPSVAALGFSPTPEREKEYSFRPFLAGSIISPLPPGTTLAHASEATHSYPLPNYNEEELKSGGSTVTGSSTGSECSSLSNSGIAPSPSPILPTAIHPQRQQNDRRPPSFTVPPSPVIITRVKVTPIPALSLRDGKSGPIVSFKSTAGPSPSSRSSSGSYTENRNSSPFGGSSALDSHRAHRLTTQPPSRRTSMAD
eukprot:GILI01024367.1.p1 GENE.GILI01024367.1~~GILI01024367.1.p1  ORF type:complete len:583 (-),score=62.33 GILI01024367.1:202-1950(-)